MPARILIIEDDLPSRELMRHLLASCGHAVFEAGDGNSGLQLARQSMPDLVLCDIHLPLLDGYAVAGLLRRDPGFARVPLLAVTTMADGDRDRVLGAGFDGYICKPIESASFVAEVEAFLPTAASPAPAATPAQATLLVVDDDAFMRDVLLDALEAEPWRLLSAGSAEEALQLLATHEVQVVLSDQCMPGLQGTELMERVCRAYPQTVRLILSGQTELEAIDRARAAGAVDRHLAKPWSAGELRGALHAAFALQRERAST